MCLRRWVASERVRVRVRVRERKQEQSVHKPGKIENIQFLKNHAVRCDVPVAVLVGTAMKGSTGALVVDKNGHVCL